MPTRHEIMASRLWTAGQLFETSVVLKRQQLRRTLPDVSEQEVTRRLSAWLRERPGAEEGDAVGKAIAWPRR